MRQSIEKLGESQTGAVLARMPSVPRIEAVSAAIALLLFAATGYLLVSTVLEIAAGRFALVSLFGPALFLVVFIPVFRFAWRTARLHRTPATLVAACEEGVVGRDDGGLFLHPWEEVSVETEEIFAPGPMHTPRRALVTRVSTATGPRFAIVGTMADVRPILRVLSERAASQP